MVQDKVKIILNNEKASTCSTHLVDALLFGISPVYLLRPSIKIETELIDIEIDEKIMKVQVQDLYRGVQVLPQDPDQLS
jgi:hypothetical protein